MSGAVAESESVQCCASCGIAEIDDIKLKNCDDCDLVKYCCDTCQGDHRSQHKEECEKRAAELHDEILFKQPEGNYYGDCKYIDECSLSSLLTSLDELPRGLLQ